MKILACVALLIAAGLGSRRPGMPEFIVLYAGDVCWGAMFFALFAAIFPHAESARLGLAAVATTELIEFSQLYRAPFADRIRAAPLGRLLFGDTFLWSDVAGVAIGATLAALFDSVVCKGSAADRVP